MKNNAEKTKDAMDERRMRILCPMASEGDGAKLGRGMLSEYDRNQDEESERVSVWVGQGRDEKWTQSERMRRPRRVEVDDAQ